MQIAGWEKNSFVDFPGRISCVIFAPGCNLNCWYCHNAGIKDEHIDFSEILAFLDRRKRFIDGVVSIQCQCAVIFYTGSIGIINKCVI